MLSGMARLKKIIDWIYEKDPEIGIGEVAAEHDVIYLSIPDGVTEEELKTKGEELGFGIEDDSIRIWV